MTHTTQLLNGTCRQFLFSPKGSIDGMLLLVDDEVIQVSLSRKKGAALSLLAKPGKPLCVLGHPDRSSRGSGRAHPVYKFESLADADGKAVHAPKKHGDTHPDKDSVAVNGVVSSLHYARHGQPNGVMLATGEFIHLRRRGMMQARLKVGSKVRAVGKLRMTLLNTRMLEAHHVNEHHLS